MPGLKYSNTAIQERLNPLADRLRVVFGVSCSERMVPNYLAFKRQVKWGDEQPLRQGLDELWEYVLGRSIDVVRIKNVMQQCETPAPDSDNFSTILTEPAQDSCFAI